MDSQVTDADDRQRPARDSVAAALDVIGDRWVFLVLREAFFGVRRFDEMRRNTGVSPNVLTDRLKKLTEAGVFERVRYGGHKNRYDYRLTEKGRDLYPVIVMLLAWGDRWETDDPPLELVHRSCGAVLGARVVCGACGEVVTARETGWRPRR